MSKTLISHDMVAYRIVIKRIAQERDQINRATGIGDKRVSKSNIDLLGALGEAAVALEFGYIEHWQNSAVQETPQSQQPDVSLLHVRTTTTGRGLLVKPNDEPNSPYVLVWGNPDTYHASIRGWAFGFEVKRDTYWKKNIQKPAYIRPEKSLFGLKSLKNWLKSAEGESHVPITSNAATG